MEPIALYDLDWDNKRLSEGCFGGEVYKTTWRYTDDNGDPDHEKVAVVNLTNRDRKEILAERDRRFSLSYGKVVQLLGWCQVSSSQRPMLVFERSSDGDLSEHLCRHAGDELTFDVKKKMAFDVARGMNYLHQQGISHGDVAARNCLVYSPQNVGDNWKVKLGDNAYYSIHYEGCYLNKPGDTVRCPVRWMAPENLPFRLRDNGKTVPSRPEKTRRGDIWSFGVLLFEIWTRGVFPFAGLTDEEVCRRVLRGWKPTDYGHVRLEDAMATMWKLMQSCWQRDPDKRPKSSTIVSTLEPRESSSDETEESDYSDEY